MKLYGIPNCDSVKKARLLLATQSPTFVDFKKTPPTVVQLRTWAQKAGWTALLNKAGSTWRGLDEATQRLAVDEAGALALMATHSSLIKRPVVEWDDGQLTVGLPALQARL